MNSSSFNISNKYSAKDEFALLQATLISNQNTIHKSFAAAVDEFGAFGSGMITEYEATIKRKNKIICDLQALLRRISQEKKQLESALADVYLSRKGSADNNASEEIAKLKRQCKELKAKLNRRAVKIQQYRLALDDFKDDGYDEDPDESDGTPDADSDGAVDIDVEMDGGDNDENPDDDSVVGDAEDSDFELDDIEKAKMEQNEETSPEAEEEEEEEEEEEGKTER